MEKQVIIMALKESINMKTNETIQSTLQDFIKYNIDGLTFEEINNLNRLKIDDSILIATHCNYVEVVRIK